MYSVSLITWQIVQMTVSTFFRFGSCAFVPLRSFAMFRCAFFTFTCRLFAFRYFFFTFHYSVFTFHYSFFTFRCTFFTFTCRFFTFLHRLFVLRPSSFPLQSIYVTASRRSFRDLRTTFSAEVAPPLFPSTSKTHPR
jgi:hypothetical protein